MCIHFIQLFSLLLDDLIYIKSAVVQSIVWWIQMCIMAMVHANIHVNTEYVMYHRKYIWEACLRYIHHLPFSISFSSFKSFSLFIRQLCWCRMSMCVCVCMSVALLPYTLVDLDFAFDIKFSGIPTSWFHFVKHFFGFFLFLFQVDLHSIINGFFHSNATLFDIKKREIVYTVRIKL